MKKLMAVLSIAFFICGHSFAQTEAQTGTEDNKSVAMSVSIEEAQAYAIENNRTVANAALSVKQERAARWQTIAALLPQVSGTLSYANYFGYQIGLGNYGGMEMPAQGNLAINATWTLTGNAIVGSIINSQAMQMADIQFRLTEQTITTNVLVTYVSILVSEQNIDLLKRNLKNMEYLLEVSQNSTRVGVTEQVETDQIQVQVAQYKNSILSAERNREVLYNMLRLYMGLGAGSDITLTQNLEEVLNMDNIVALLNTELNLDNNYDYQISKKNEEMAKKQIALTAMDYVPSLSATYSYTTKKYFDDEYGFDMTPPNYLGVTLNVPLWSSGKRAAAVTESKLAYKAAQNTLADTKDQLQLKDNQYRFNLANAIDDYTVQKNNVEVTERVLKNISQKYEFGYSSSVDVTTASQDLITAQTNYTTAVYTMVEAYMNLKNLLNM